MSAPDVEAALRKWYERWKPACPPSLAMDDLLATVTALVDAAVQYDRQTRGVTAVEHMEARIEAAEARAEAAERRLATGLTSAEREEWETA